MKPEHLESLLADRALDELSPEVAALLDEHLEHNPDAARQAAMFDSTLRLARAAVAMPLEHPGTLDHSRLRRERPLFGFHLAPVEILRVAAGLAAGIAIGWVLRPQPVETPQVAAATTITGPLTLHAPTTTTNFWSVRRFASKSTPSQSK